MGRTNLDKEREELKKKENEPVKATKPYCYDCKKAVDPNHLSVRKDHTIRWK